MGLLPSINDLGVVVGTADGNGIETYGDSTYTECADLIQPFIWTQTVGIKGLGTRAFHSMGHLCYIPMFATANNINGQIVGYTGYFATFQTAFLWENNNWTALAGPEPPYLAMQLTIRAKSWGKWDIFMAGGTHQAMQRCGSTVRWSIWELC